MTGGYRNSQELHETTEIFREKGDGVSGVWEIAKKGDLPKPMRDSRIGIIGNSLYLTGGLAKDGNGEGNQSKGEKRQMEDLFINLHFYRCFNLGYCQRKMEFCWKDGLLQI